MPDNRLRPPSIPEVIIPGIPDLPVVQLVKRNRPVTWLAGITVVLVVFLVFLPLDIRMLFWHSLQSQSVLVSLLLIFSLVALSLVWSAGQRLDAWVFLSFNLRGRRPLWLDRIMVACTQIGNGFATLAFALVLFLAGEPFLAYELILGTLTLWLMIVLIKSLVRRSRPFIRLTQARIVGLRESGRSFPSGHTAQSFFIATLFIQHFHTSVEVAISLYALALWVGITRMYVGAHYPRDVIAGSILGSAWGLLGVIVEGYVIFQ